MRISTAILICFLAPTARMVRQTADGRLVPETAYYRVLIGVEDQNLRVTQLTRGEVKVEAERLSLLSRAWTSMLAVLIREISF